MALPNVLSDMAAVSVRPFEEGEESAVAALLDRCFGGFETWSAARVAEMAAGAAPPAGLWVALEGGQRVGCVMVREALRPGMFVVRDLAGLEEEVAEQLLGAVLAQLGEVAARLVRSSTLNLAPYPELYRRRGFVPVRRALTFVWHLSGVAAEPATGGEVVVAEADRHPPEELAEIYVEGMRPYWDWFIEERGGADGYKERVAAHIAALSGGEELWLAAEVGGTPVGLSFVSGLGEEEASLGGVYVLPSYRNRGAGSALLSATLAELRRRGVERLVVHETVTGLEEEIPSIRLYRRSGARERAEYLHLEWQERGEGPA